VVAGGRKFGAAIIGYIFNNSGKVIGGIAILALALWFAGGIDSLFPFFYEQMTGKSFSSSGYACAIGSGNESG
jgi:hypothetical protein